MLKKTTTKKATTFGADLIGGMKLVLAHQRGKVELEQVWPKPIDVKAIRKRVKMSQSEFSRWTQYLGTMQCNEDFMRCLVALPSRQFQSACSFQQAPSET